MDLKDITVANSSEAQQPAQESASPNVLRKRSEEARSAAQSVIDWAEHSGATVEVVQVVKAYCACLAQSLSLPYTAKTGGVKLPGGEFIGKLTRAASELAGVKGWTWDRDTAKIVLDTMIKQGKLHSVRLGRASGVSFWPSQEEATEKAVALAAKAWLDSLEMKEVK